MGWWVGESDHSYRRALKSARGKLYSPLFNWGGHDISGGAANAKRRVGQGLRHDHCGEGDNGEDRPRHSCGIGITQQILLFT